MSDFALYLTEEPDEVVPQVRICAWGAGQPAFLPRLPKRFIEKSRKN